MIIENNKNEVTKSIDEELRKIENYTEQALFYARSNTVEKDYYIKKVVLKEVVNDSIKKNKDILIHEKILVNVHDLEVEVYIDNKWIEFILNQIIQNSIKYKKEDRHLEIEIYAKTGKENVVLYIKANGRLIGKKSTGIGLYLCKKLCIKLGITIKLNSVQNVGTEIQLIFPKSSYTELQ